jgi:transposase
MNKIQSWEVSDSFWERAEKLLPKKKRDPKKKYKRKPGAGRKPIEPRKAFEGIVYVLRTGIQWKALPKEKFGSPSSIHDYFQKWEADGFFLRLWKAGLHEYNEMEGIAWKWQSADGAMNKAPLAQESVGANPTDRGKKWSKKKSSHRRKWNPFITRRMRSKCA